MLKNCNQTIRPQAIAYGKSARIRRRSLCIPVRNEAAGMFFANVRENEFSFIPQKTGLYGIFYKREGGKIADKLFGDLFRDYDFCDIRCTMKLNGRCKGDFELFRDAYRCLYLKAGEKYEFKAFVDGCTGKKGNTILIDFFGEPEKIDFTPPPKRNFSIMDIGICYDGFADAYRISQNIMLDGMRAVMKFGGNKEIRLGYDDVRCFSECVCSPAEIKDGRNTVNCSCLGKDFNFDIYFEE